MIGGITIESQPAASRTSNSTAVGPPTRVLGRDRGPLRGSVRPGRRPRSNTVSAPSVAWTRMPGGPSATGGETASTPSTAATASRTAGRRPRSRTTMSVSAVVARGEALVEQLLAFDRFDFVAVAVFAGQFGREEGEAGAEDEQDDDRAGHDPRGRGRDPVADPFPEAVGGVGGVLALVAAHLVGREDRPVERADDQRRDPAAAEHAQEPVDQDQRQQDEHQQAGDEDPSAARRTGALDDPSPGALGDAVGAAARSRACAGRRARRRGGRRSSAAPAAASASRARRRRSRSRRSGRGRRFR